ncbi:L-amino-acid oxidase-like [Physella acuta]|uniref:L-amino-acid oxidase-like n=1 Tax=Physella acuta TaxID=109671 RepID=UPI0027DD5800|nr:L-amino-acid oxidase-like [Physella acuta]
MKYTILLCLFGLAFGQLDPNWRITDQCQRNVDVAVIGAGATGSYAAYMLKDKNLAVEVVEMSNSIGGRHLTAYMPGAPDVPVELGQRAYADIHDIMQKIVPELGLTPLEFPEALGIQGSRRYFLRGKNIKEEEIISGIQLPYTLTPEEKQNQGRIVQHYYKKLTGLELTQKLSMPERLQVKVIKTNRPLHEHKLDEALDLVASPEGKEFFKAIVKGKWSLSEDASAWLPFGFEMDYNRDNTTFYRVKEGMDAIPKKLIEKFTNVSPRNVMTFNRKVEAIQRFQNMTYILKLKETKTVDGRTFELGPEEFLCAQQIILAIPKHSLEHLQWSVTKDYKNREALKALRTVPQVQVAMTFTYPFWQATANEKAKVKFTDTILGSAHDLGASNNKYILLASLNYGEQVRQIERLNLQGNSTSGSAQGVYQVSEVLKDTLLDILSKMYDVSRDKMIQPVYSVSKIWTLPPHTGGLTVWRAGYNYEDVRKVLLRPSIVDKVFIATPDIAFGARQAWTEGGLIDVQSIISTYFQ